MNEVNYMLRDLRFGFVLLLNIVLFTASGLAGDTAQFDQALRAVTNALPPGWTVAVVETNAIPYGHHYGENYTGPIGIFVVAKGIRGSRHGHFMLEFLAVLV